MKIITTITIIITQTGQKRCRRGYYGCENQLIINEMIAENCKKRKLNFECTCIDYKEAFDSVPHE